MVCGFPLAASSATETMPERVPDADGVKVTFIVQLDATPRLEGQLFVSEKSKFEEIEEIFKDAVPLLVRVIGCAALAVPTN